MNKKIILTGGGTAGHVTPNLALVPGLKAAGFDILYVGSYTGMEKELAEKEGLAYRGIATGKLRRYFDWKNFTDPFRVLKGFREARRILREYRPDIVFSKGGFVSVPVVFAAKRAGIPVVSHESDLTPGLANRLTLSSVTRVCCNFPETLQHLPADKAVLTGSPIRRTLLSGDRESGLRFAGLNGQKPVLLIIGGSLGSVKLNTLVRALLPKLLEQFELIHLCGKNNVDESLAGTPGYAQFAYVSEELPDVLAAAELVLSRAGANAICELLALKKPNLLIPLSAQASRGDQLLNAASFKAQGFSMVLREEDANEESLLQAIQSLWANRADYLAAMESSSQKDGVAAVLQVIEACLAAS